MPLRGSLRHGTGAAMDLMLQPMDRFFNPTTACSSADPPASAVSVTGAALSRIPLPPRRLMSRYPRPLALSRDASSAAAAVLSPPRSAAGSRAHEPRTTRRHAADAGPHETRLRTRAGSAPLALRALPCARKLRHARGCTKGRRRAGVAETVSESVESVVAASFRVSGHLVFPSQWPRRWSWCLSSFWS